MPQNSQLAVNILRRWFFPLFLCKACNSAKKFQVQKFHYYYLTHFNFKRIICIDRNCNYYNYISAMRVILCRHLRYVLITVPNVNCILSWSIRLSRKTCSLRERINKSDCENRLIFLIIYANYSLAF